jgi:hypothetical protein
MLGSTAAARRAAIAWRDATLIEAKTLGILEFCERRRGNNTSGVAGVSFSKSSRQPDGIWQARLKLDGGKTLTKSFSVRLYGKRKAFALAVSARRRMLASAQDRPFVHHALAKRVARADARTTVGVGRGCRVPPTLIRHTSRTA